MPRRTKKVGLQTGIYYPDDSYHCTKSAAPAPFCRCAMVALVDALIVIKPFFVNLSNSWNRGMFGSIQEDRHKVEQFHNLWNSVLKMWNSSSKSGTGPVSGSQFHKLWKRGPNLTFQIFQQLHNQAKILVSSFRP